MSRWFVVTILSEKRHTFPIKDIANIYSQIHFKNHQSTNIELKLNLKSPITKVFFIAFLDRWRLSWSIVGVFMCLST